MKADVVLLNGNVFVLNEVKNLSIAIKDKIIVGVGEQEEVSRLIGENTTIIDLQSRIVLPGLMDSHIHFISIGLENRIIPLNDLRSISELKNVISKVAKSKKANEWIIGRGWDQSKFVEKRMPTRYDLDENTPENPVLLKRICGHVATINTKALSITGLDKMNIDGMDLKNGVPTGILKEEAMYYVSKYIPKPTTDELKQAVEVASQKLFSKGITSACFMSGISDETIYTGNEFKAISQAIMNGSKTVRIHSFLNYRLLDNLVDLGITCGFGNDSLRINGIKIILDGSIGARTAALTEPYEDDAKNYGLINFDKDELYRIFVKAHKAGLQVAIHAIGDKAIEMALDIIEKTLADYPVSNHRHRIEHATLIRPDLIERAKNLGVIISIQPSFIGLLSKIIEARIGKERLKWFLPIRTLIKNGVLTAGGSDYPVHSYDPFLGIHYSVNRELNQEESISIKDAIKIYTLNAAYASFSENYVGKIAEGYRADIVVIDKRDLKDVASGYADVYLTLSDGKVVYKKNV